MGTEESSHIFTRFVFYCSGIFTHKTGLYFPCFIPNSSQSSLYSTLMGQQVNDLSRLHSFFDLKHSKYNTFLWFQNIITAIQSPLRAYLKSSYLETRVIKNVHSFPIRIKAIKCLLSIHVNLVVLYFHISCRKTNKCVTQRDIVFRHSPHAWLILEPRLLFSHLTGVAVFVSSRLLQC